VLELSVFAQVGSSDELVGSQIECLLLFAVGPGEDNDSATNLGRELDREMSKTTDTHDSDDIGGLDAL
jgi:hypothetical protein